MFGSIALTFRVKMVGREGGRGEKRRGRKRILFVSMLSCMQSQCGEQPYVSMAANTSCLLFFLFALLNPLHVQYEISVRAETQSNLACSPHLSLPLLAQVVLVSLVFLLLQPDGWLLPRTSSIFLAPSLVAASLLLYFLAGSRIIPKTLSALSKGSSIFLASESTREQI